MLLIDQDFLPQATAIIGMAQRSIDITTFKAELCLKPRGRRLQLFFDVLIEKRKNGVQIRFLINWHNEQRCVPLTNLVVMRELAQCKIDVRVLPANRCCHAKILLVDQRRAIIGSHNLSVKSCHNNFEVSYLISDPASLARLSEVFEHTFQNSQRP